METLLDLFEACLSPAKERHLAWREQDGTWASWSSGELAEVVGLARAGLRALGLGQGDRVAILAANSERWAACDFAMVGAGMVTVPLYPSLTPEQVAHALEDSGCAAILVGSDAHRHRLAGAMNGAGVSDVVVLGGDVDGELDGLRTITWTELLELGRRSGTGGEHPLPGPEDLASILYTSGTTGPPKGVMLTHRNLVSNALACREAIDLRLPPIGLSLLPLCHIFQRLTDYFLFLRRATIAYCPDPLAALEYMAEVRPTFFASVPRLFEKVRSGVLTGLQEAPPLRRAVGRWALEVGRRSFRAHYRDGACDGRPGPWLAVQRWVADRLVLGRIRDLFGGRVELCISGGAALSPEVQEFLRSVGLGVLPGYGLTESSPVICTNRRDRMKLGSAGLAIRGVDVKVAEDGELLARGPNVMKGYWNRPDATAEAVRDGWLYTGDLATIDDDGFVFITGRKKEILVLSTGKNVSPQVVEDQLARCPLVTQVVVVGDGRKFVSALVRANPVTLAAALARRGLPPPGEAEPPGPEAEELVLESFAEVGSALAGYELPKRVAFLPRDLDQAHGELTPTLKFKRTEILANWGHLVAAHHEEPTAGVREGA